MANRRGTDINNTIIELKLYINFSFRLQRGFRQNLESICDVVYRTYLYLFADIKKKQKSIYKKNKYVKIFS